MNVACVVLGAAAGVKRTVSSLPSGVPVLALGGEADGPGLGALAAGKGADPYWTARLPGNRPYAALVAAAEMAPPLVRRAPVKYAVVLEAGVELVSGALTTIVAALAAGNGVVTWDYQVGARRVACPPFRGRFTSAPPAFAVAVKLLPPRPTSWPVALTAAARGAAHLPEFLTRT